MDYKQKSKLAENLIRIRKNMGLTQEQVASSLGIKRSTYAYYEKNTMPPIKTIEHLAKLFGTTPNELMFGRPEKIQHGGGYSFLEDGPESNPLIGERFEPPTFNQLTPFEQKFYLKMRLLPDHLKQQLLNTLNELWEKADLD